MLKDEINETESKAIKARTTKLLEKYSNIGNLCVIISEINFGNKTDVFGGTIFVLVISFAYFDDIVIEPIWISFPSEIIAIFPLLKLYI